MQKKFLLNRKVVWFIIIISFILILILVFNCGSGENSSNSNSGSGGGNPLLTIMNWNPGISGGIPTYTQGKTACNSGCDYTTTGNGTTNDATPIQSCINAVSVGQYCLLKTGSYGVGSAILIPAGKELRGEGTSSTVLRNRWGGGVTLKMGNNSATRDATKSISSGYTKGSTTLTMAAGHGYITGNYIAITQTNDSSIVQTTGDDGFCSWCGNGTGAYVMAQIVKVTVSGNTLTLDAPLYYTFTSGQNPVASRISNMAENAGVQNLAIVNYDTTSGENGGYIWFEACANCWAKNVEVSNHHCAAVRFEYSRGSILRDSYIHDGQDLTSGKSYGTHIMYWNSDHLIENNIYKAMRHGVVWEGGGSGCVVGYNYMTLVHDENYDVQGHDIIFHGAHPYMNLIEGNIHGHYSVDFKWGSSSYNTYFRNNPFNALSDPAVTVGKRAIDINRWNRYQNVIGSVLGYSGMGISNGPVASATGGENSCGIDEAWRLGCQNDSSTENPPIDSLVQSTLTHCGNYSYSTRLTDGSYWTAYSGFVASSLPGIDVSCGATIPNSYYLSSKPSFFGNCTWPAIGPDVGSYVNDIPAKRKYDTMTGSPKDFSTGTYTCP